MKISSHLALAVARALPRGYWPILRYAAHRDAALQDFPLRLTNGEMLRADFRESVYVGIWRYGCIGHQRGLDALTHQIVRNGDVVFDVGANVGYTTLAFARAVGDAGRVIAFEPGRKAFSLLQRTIAHKRNVTALQLAVSSAAGTATFHESPSLDISSLEPVATSTSYDVPTATLDALASQYGEPSLVKIDVEGHEPAVFDGMSRLLNSAHPPIVVFEALTDTARRDCLTRLGNMAVIRRVHNSGALVPIDYADGMHDYVAFPAWAVSRIT